MLIQILMLTTVVVAGITAGGAWVYTIEIHPSLVEASPRSSLDVFTPLFNHANRAQPILGGIVLISSLAVAFLSGNWLWLVGGIIPQLIAPYTIFGMMPLNRRLMAYDIDAVTPEAIEDLRHWGTLHLVRTLINSAAFIFFCALLVLGK